MKTGRFQGARNEERELTKAWHGECEQIYGGPRDNEPERGTGSG